MKKGYSLIELTITVGLVSVLALTISAVVLSTVINSYRLRNLVHVREVGDYVTGQIERMIRNAKSASCDSPNNQVTIINQDNNSTTIQISSDRIASSSASTVYLTPSDLEVPSFSIDCKPSDTDPQLVNIAFTLRTTSDPNARPHDNPSLDFSSSIEFRNLYLK